MTKNSCREIAATLPNISCRIAHDPRSCISSGWNSGPTKKMMMSMSMINASLFKKQKSNLPKNPSKELKTCLCAIKSEIRDPQLGTRN